MRILFITGRFPYPPLRGDQLIPFHRMMHLAKRHEVTLLSFVQNEDEISQASRFAAICRNVRTVFLPKWRSYVNMMLGFSTAVPFQVLYYRSPAFSTELARMLDGGCFDIIHAVLARVAGHTFAVRKTPVVCEMIDALSLTMERRAQATNGPERWLSALEANRMRVFEQEISRRCDRVLVVSEKDRQHIGTSNTVVVPAGVDVEERCRTTGGSDKTVIFTGNFDYYPNRDAANFLLNDIWPKIHASVPRVRLKIAGNNPNREILRLAQQLPNVEVTGYVADLNAHFLSADVAICPVRLGGAGMHRKVIEAMNCGTPVIVSPLVTGLENGEDRAYLRAESASDFAQAVRQVVEQPSLAMDLSRRARQLVHEKYSWSAAAVQLERVYDDILSQRNAGELGR